MKKRILYLILTMFDMRKKIVFILMLCLNVILGGCGTKNEINNVSTQEKPYTGAPMIVINGNKYFSDGKIVNELPDGYTEIGELTEEETKYASIIGNKYYADLRHEDLREFYVYQECGTPSETKENHIDNEKRQWAYVLWSRESKDTEGKNTYDDENSQTDSGMLAQCVMVDGHIYKNTGYVSSMIGCGNMDGSIDSTVEPSKLPEQDNQSNFGTGYGYQRGGSMQILVVIDGEKYIFQDLASSSLEIPREVANFTAKIKAIGEGSMEVSYITHPDGFRIDKGNYIVPIDNLQSEVEVGDTVTIWFNGMVMESEPAQIGVVYRIEKVD